jgi:DNA-directed RNA polymerase subunit beta'
MAEQGSNQSPMIFRNRVIDKKQLKKLISWSFDQFWHRTHRPNG